MKNNLIRIVLVTMLIMGAFTVVYTVKASELSFEDVLDEAIEEMLESARQYNVQSLTSLRETLIEGTFLDEMSSKEFRLRDVQEYTIGNLLDESYIDASGTELKSGSDITKYIALCDDYTTYKTRKRYDWYVGSDSVITYIPELDTTMLPRNPIDFTFTAPITGEFRIRIERDAYSAITIRDNSTGYTLERCKSSMSEIKTTSLSTFEDCDWYVVNVIKGEKYTMTMYSLGITNKGKIDMMFIKVLYTGNNYKQNKWYVYTYIHKIGKYLLENSDSSDYDKENAYLASESLIKVSLTEKSKVSLYLRDLTNLKTGLSVKTPKLEVYKKDSKSSTGYTLYKTVEYKLGSEIEIGYRAGKQTVILPKGTYYIRIDTLTGSSLGYDFAFKYKVDAVKTK